MSMKILVENNSKNGFFFEILPLLVRISEPLNNALNWNDMFHC